MTWTGSFGPLPGSLDTPAELVDPSASCYAQADFQPAQCRNSSRLFEQVELAANAANARPAPCQVPSVERDLRDNFAGGGAPGAGAAGAAGGVASGPFDRLAAVFGITATQLLLFFCVIAVVAYCFSRLSTVTSQQAQIQQLLVALAARKT